MNKLSDGMIVCKHGVLFDSECGICHQNAVDRYKSVDDIFKSDTYTGENQKYEIKNSLEHAHDTNQAKHICIWGAPGTGKSTIAAGVFHEMKKRDYDVELVLEYAKSLVFSKDYFRMKNQLYILAKQSHPWFKLDSQVQYTVNDSPFLMGLIYAQDSKHLPLKEFIDLTVKMYKGYDTINIFLLRNFENRYTEHGRNQTESEALNIQNDIAKLLLFHDIPHVKIMSSETSVQEIINLL